LRGCRAPHPAADDCIHGLFIGLVLLALGGSAAPAAAIDLGTDRDAFTPSTRTIAPGVALAESSHVYIDNRTGLPTNNYPELLVRVGATERWEWRLGVNYGVGSQGNVVTSVEVGEGTLDGSTLYESNVLYGFKLDLSDQDGWVPEGCLIMEGTTPTYGDIFGTVPVATLVGGWALPLHVPWLEDEPWRLDAALRYSYAEGHVEWFDRWTPSAVLRMPLRPRLEAHLEWFGSFTQGLADDLHQPFASPGFHVIIADDVELGLRVGWGLTRESAPFFSDAGLAIRY
jgi:hypothetical protein